MPRKVNYGVDYDHNYDDYDDDYADDYDYDYDYPGERNGKAAETMPKKEASKTGVWRCPICTYDNEDSMSACDICGVLRNPLVKVNAKSDNAAALFKFDAPSPDDLVSNGLQSLKLKSKGKVSSERDTNDTVEIELNAKGKESSSASVSVTRDRNNGISENDSASVSGKKPEFSDSTVDTKPLSSKTGKADTISKGKTTSFSQYTPEAWMISDKTDGELRQLNLAIVGHVDSGKSTLSGRLLHLLGCISQKEMHKYEKEAKQQGKGSFAYAWALDESAEERERGITMTVGVAFFTSNKYHVVLLDSPGHRDFVPNMISGATQADAAILVVDASMGSFEAGIDATKGQTKEHAQLIRSFGVDQIIVAVNKMDVVEYSKQRFDFVKQKLGTFLRSCGFKEPSISWVPVSVMENQNLVTNSSDARFSWFKGPSLLDAIDSFQLPERDCSKPLLTPKLNSMNLSLLIFILLLSTTATAAAEGCNAARIGDCLAEEFLMESETTRRVLAGGKRIQPLIPKKPFCDAKVYNSCNREPNARSKQRPCDYKVLCRSFAK